MEYKMQTILALAFLLGDLTNGKVKDPDEDRAYEFGFTIEGMQHRHEKKDVNGIIQGEFGFITADGVYHVTVYATDENGNFRIISMKNIKVSPPLDGSPDFGSHNYASVPRGPQTITKQSSLPNASPPSTAIKQKNEFSPTKRPNRVFTTQPTLKPSCAGCGYITTSKKPPIGSVEHIMHHTVVNTGVFSEKGGLVSNLPPSGTSFASSEPSRISPGSKYSNFDNIKAIYPGETLNKASPNRLFDGGVSSIKKFPQNSSPYLVQNNRGAPTKNSQGPQIFENRFDDFKNEKSHSYTGRLPALSDSLSHSGNLPDEMLRQVKDLQHSHQTNRKQQPVKVSNGLIKIPGNPDIPIKDKYPGMVDGLPPGINEDDITTILYRFNWTVGFQGHYETGYKNGAKIGGYFVNGSDGISRVVTYVADEFGYRPKVKIINIGLDSPDTPKDDKTFELKSFEFVWYPVK